MSGEKASGSTTGVFLQVGLGVASTFLLHVVVGGGLTAAVAVATSVSAQNVVTGLLSMALGYWAMGVGMLQVFYVGPVALAAAFVRRPIALGMVIGAAVTFLLQGACYGLFALTMLVFIGAESGMM